MDKIKSGYSKVILFLLIVFLGGNLESNAQRNNRNDAPISDEHYKILEKRKELIEQEISAKSNEWAGVYTQGDHHPTVFMWSENQGFLIWGSHHTFYPSGINFGEAKFSDNRLILKPEISRDHLNYQHIATELVPIKWGEQHFLIPADELMDFAYAVHSEAGSQIVRYLAKRDNYDKKRTGFPTLPKEFETILKMKAIKTKITSIEKSRDNLIFDSVLTLNVGRKHRVIEGMVFFWEDSENHLTIQVTELEDESSKARVISIISIGERGEDFEPRAGLRLSSKVKTDFGEF